MKILQIVPAVSVVYGGPSQMVRGLSAALARQNVTVEILTTDANGDVGQPSLGVPLNQPLPEDNYTVRYFRCAPWRRYKFSLGLCTWLWRNAHRYDLAHIHALFSPVSTAAATIARWRKLPYLLRPLGTLDPADLRKKLRLKQLYGYCFERPNLAGAAALHFTSSQEAEISERYGTNPMSLVIPLGVPLLTFPDPGQVRQRWQIAADVPLILYMSRIDLKKGIELLIESLAILRAQNLPFHLVLAGSNAQDPAYERLIGDHARQQLGEQVTIAGFVRDEEKLALLRDADLFVLPSYYENFGIAVAEAMAAQTPVLISDQVHIWPAVQQAQAGWIAQCRSDALTAALTAALTDPIARQTRGQNAYHLAKTAYSWDAIAAELLAAYRSILHTSGR
ncbi:MAG: hormogonium polysaccharide biosynthesis glycosyltransferase HpsP [Cyanobacteria bacterium P01_G01_bin.54]